MERFGIETAHAECSGGGVYLFYGTLKDGRRFFASTDFEVGATVHLYSKGSEEFGFWEDEVEEKTLTKDSAEKFWVEFLGQCDGNYEQSSLEKMAGIIRQRRINRVENYFVYFEEGEVGISSDSDGDRLLTELSRAICFSDCYDFHVLKVVYNGKECSYAGWQPDMLFEYVDEDGQVVWSWYFPQWDH